MSLVTIDQQRELTLKETEGQGLLLAQHSIWEGQPVLGTSPAASLYCSRGGLGAGLSYWVWDIAILLQPS
jgi:hypothetical protein